MNKGIFYWRWFAIVSGLCGLLMSCSGRTGKYITQLDSPNLYVQKTAIYILGEKEAVAAVPSLLRHLEGAPEDITLEIIKALGKIKSEDATPQLLSLLDSPNRELKLAAIEAIGMIKDKRGVDPLLSILSEPGEAEVKIMSLWALGNIGDGKALPILIKLKKDNDKFIAYNAEHALSMIK